MDLFGRRRREEAAAGPAAGCFLIRLLSDEQGNQPIHSRWQVNTGEAPARRKILWVASLLEPRASASPFVLHHGHL